MWLCVLGIMSEKMFHWRATSILKQKFEISRSYSVSRGFENLFQWKFVAITHAELSQRQLHFQFWCSVFILFAHPAHRNISATRLLERVLLGRYFLRRSEMARRFAWTTVSWLRLSRVSYFVLESTLYATCASWNNYETIVSGGNQTYFQKISILERGN